MDVPLAIHVDTQGVETLPPRQGRLVLQARSLRNTLSVLLRRLKHKENNKLHTFEDVQHYKVRCVWLPT